MNWLIRRTSVAAVILSASVLGFAQADVKQAVEAIKKMGGEVHHEESNPTKPIFEIDFLKNPKLTDEDLGKLVSHLKQLPQLRDLGLGFTKVTDAGLVQLKELKLQRVSLAGTKVTDAGLAHLKGLKMLKELNLIMTKVTDKGVADLQKALPKLKITHRVK